MKGVIYKATNRENKKAYIGQSIKVVIRISRHKQAAEENKDTHFYRAIRLYGWDAFDWEVLYFDIPQNQLRNMEIWCIANHSTYENGYNSTEGGDDNPMNYPESRKKISESKKGKKRQPFSEEWKKKLGEASKGRVITKETRNKISIAQTGENNSFFGKTHSQENIEKVRKANIGKCVSKETRRKHSEQARKENLSEETLKKRSAALKGKSLSVEHKKKISASMSGENHPNFGKHLPEETRKKMSEAAILREAAKRNKIVL